MATSEEDEASEANTDSLLGSSGDEAPPVMTIELLRGKLEINRDFGVPPGEVARCAHNFMTLNASVRAIGQELANARAMLSSLVSEGRDISRQLREMGGQ